MLKRLRTRCDLIGTVNGTILAVDDTSLVLDMLKEVLEKYGFKVLAAQDGQTAVDVFRERADQISLVLLDLDMPSMDGEETLGLLQSIRPHVRVLLSSGYSEIEASERFTGKGLADFVQKPYSAAELVEKIRGVLYRSQKEN